MGLSLTNLTQPDPSMNTLFDLSWQPRPRNLVYCGKLLVRFGLDGWWAWTESHFVYILNETSYLKTVRT